MVRLVRKAAATLLLLGLATWWLRLMAHAKRPPAEGRWRELRLDSA